MSKHTPGPWLKGRRPGSIVAYSVPEGREDEDTRICDTSTYGGHLIAESVATCNMELVLCAPELLEAAKRVLAASDLPGFLQAMRTLEEAVRQAEPAADV